MRQALMFSPSLPASPRTMTGSPSSVMRARPREVTSAAAVRIRLSTAYGRQGSDDTCVCVCLSTAWTSKDSRGAGRASSR